MATKTTSLSEFAKKLKQRNLKKSLIDVRGLLLTKYQQYGKISLGGEYAEVQIEDHKRHPTEF
jgi:hypothetical protein